MGKVNGKLKKVEKLKLFYYSNFTNKKYVVTSDYEEALDYALDYDNWVNLKHKAFEEIQLVLQKSVKKFKKASEKFESIKLSVENSLKKAHINIECEQLYKEIQDDLTLCIQSSLVSKRKNKHFFGEMFNAYKLGLWPCGYEGVYPNGKLIVYQNKKKND